MYSQQEALIASIMSAADEAGLLTDPTAPSEREAMNALLTVAIPRPKSARIEPMEDFDPADLIDASTVGA